MEAVVYVFSHRSLSKKPTTLPESLLAPGDWKRKDHRNEVRFKPPVAINVIRA